MLIIFLSAQTSMSNNTTLKYALYITIIAPVTLKSDRSLMVVSSVVFANDKSCSHTSRALSNAYLTILCLGTL